MAFFAIAVFLFMNATKQPQIEGFFGTNPSVCRKVAAGKYPQVSMDGVIDAATCVEIIKDAEAHAAAIKGGWTTRRHAAYPTTDLDTKDIKTLRFPIQNLVYRRIIPRLAKAFDLHELKLGIGEVFIAKYEAKAGAQRSLATHTDGSDFSFVIALNEGFTGGGTKFAQSGQVKRPGVGSATGFCGKSRHQGIAVTSGTRYILAGFLKYETPQGCESDSDDE